jgi:hypothetical protein
VQYLDQFSPRWTMPDQRASDAESKPSWLIATAMMDFVRKQTPDVRVIVVGAPIRVEHKVNGFEDGGFWGARGCGGRCAKAGYESVSIAFSETWIRLYPTMSETSSEDNERSINEMIALRSRSVLSTLKIPAGSSMGFDP